MAPAPGAPNGAPSGAAPAAGPAVVNGVAPVSGDTDAQLAAMQSRAVEVARGELAAGVREQGGPNRGPRIDAYARDAGMPVGGAWCGYFTGFAYAEAARQEGGSFPENVRFHSFQKARSYFEYRTFTNASAAENQRLDRLQAQHQAEGSTRRFMVLAGSSGERHAQSHGRPHEVYDPSTLPLRPGDTALFNRGHVGLVESYDPGSGRLVTLEGNTAGGRVARKTYDLNDPAVRASFEGFGRPALGDFRRPAASDQAPAAQAPASQPVAQAPELPREVVVRDRRGFAARGEGATSGPKAGDATASDRSSPELGASPRAADPVAHAPSMPANAADPSAPTLGLPPRSAGAQTGSALAAEWRGLSPAAREAAILREIEAGNVPDFLRTLQPVEVSARGRDGATHTARMYVLPDYLAVGSNEDFLRVPLTPATAQRIADRLDMSLPTRKMVNDVYGAASQRLSPQPIPPGAHMVRVETFARHQAMIEAQRGQRGAEAGELTAGHKKDLVISNNLTARPDRVAIYGWHQPNGRPIQGLSTLHESSYADYSHGVRLAAQTVVVDGQVRRLEDVLRDPNLAPLFSDEGALRDPRVPGVPR